MIGRAALLPRRHPSPLVPATAKSTGGSRRMRTGATDGALTAAAAAAAAAPDGASGLVVVSVPPRPLPDLSTIRGVLFDIDGTLTESDPLHLLAFQQVLQEAGFNGGAPISEAFFRDRISGRHNPEIAADLFPHWGEAQKAALIEAKEQRFRDLAGTQLAPMPGLARFMTWLESRELRRAAVTNAPAANTKLMLGALRLDSWFEAVVLGEECARAKPHPDPYLRALELLSLQPHEALVIEDSPAGLRAAVAAGIPVVGITSGQSAETLRQAGASAIIRDFHALVERAQRDTDTAQQAAAALAAPPAVPAASPSL